MARSFQGAIPLRTPQLRWLLADGLVTRRREAWMLRAALDGQRCQTLEPGPFTLSTFGVGDVPGFTQTDLALMTPELQRCRRQ
jgi:hypothetical protein